MSVEIIPIEGVAHRRKKTKVTCTTCNLKGCIGRCQWKTVARPPAPKAAA